jgi:uncharacterized protein
VIRSSKTGWYLIGIIIVLVIIQKIFIFYTDYLWFANLDQAAVFMTILKSRILLAVLFGGVFFAFIYINARLARRPLSKDITLIGKRLLPDEEREQIETYADKAILIFCLVGALMVAAVAAAHWREWLQFIHAVPFSETGAHNDPIFQRDAGFYVFKLDFILYAWRSVFYGIVITLIVTVLIHLYQEAIRFIGNTVQAIPRARFHVLSLLALAFFAKIYSYRLMQFSLLYSAHGKDFFGASYADVHARLPLMTVLMVTCAIAGIATLVSIRSRSMTIPAGAIAAVFLVSILGGWLYPAAIQKLVVDPNELVREEPFIANNIKATNLAYGTDAITDKLHQVGDPLTWDDINNNLPTVSNIRLWDHRPLETCFQQMQALRKYYQFADVDVDRYELNGEVRQVMLSARQLAYDRISPTFVNQYLLYTHGYGVAMSPVAEVAEGAEPVYWIKDLPPQSSVGINITRPAIYYTTSWHPRLIERISPPEFVRDAAQQREQTPGPLDEQPGGPGEQPSQAPRPSGPAGVDPRPAGAPLFAIVNTSANELDYPISEGAGEENAYTRYSGTGGVQLTNIWRKIAFAIRFRKLDILLTEYITTQSRIMMYRELPERLTALAPFLAYDPDPYIMIADNGELKWICDAYTVSNMYPYSMRTTWFANYVRNSVKVVVDAYEGRPEFHVVDPDDPVIRCYQKIFPSLFKTFEDMSPSVKKHLRYPQLLFRIQAGVYAKYHMKNPQTFYQAEDEWAIPPEIYSQGYREVEAYYQVIKLVGAEKEEFLLVLPYVLAKFERKNMVAWMAARCDPEHYGELIVYRFPKKSLVFGPMQFEAKIDQDANLSELFTLWSQSGSDVIRGNTLVIPVADNFLYVEPIYLESTDSAIPELKLVVLMHGNNLVYGPTLDEALVQLLGPDGRQAITESVAQPIIEPTTTEAVVAPPTGLPVSDAQLDTIRDLLRQALALDQEAEGYLKQGDLGNYRDKQKQQQDIIERIERQLTQ